MSPLDLHLALSLDTRCETYDYENIEDQQWLPQAYCCSLGLAVAAVIAAFLEDGFLQRPGGPSIQMQWLARWH